MKPVAPVAFIVAMTDVGMENERDAMPTVVIETGPQPVASVIWLHGLGADGHDFGSIVPELRLPADLPLRFIFPHAPYRPVTWNNGYVMRAWYDIGVTDRGFFHNIEHLREAEATVHQFVAEEAGRGIESSRIVLAGFSQGGAVVLHAGLHCASPLAGILCLSAPAPNLDQLVSGVAPANADTPIFLAHGEQDVIVPFQLAQQAHERLTAAGIDLEWHRYPTLGHGVCVDEIADISGWLRRVLGVRPK